MQPRQPSAEAAGQVELGEAIEGFARFAGQPRRCGRSELPRRRTLGTDEAETREQPKRHVYLSRFDETFHGDGRDFPISSARYGGTFSPAGHHFVDACDFHGHPRFTYRIGHVTVEREVLRVPRDSLMVRGEQQGLYVIEDGVARYREVEVGISVADWVEITAGLEGGETVVTLGANLLKDGDPVSVAGAGRQEQSP